MVELSIFILALAFWCETTIRYFLDPWRSHWPVWLHKQVPRWVSCALGVFLAWNFRLDLFALAGWASRGDWIAFGLTGVILGRGSNYANDFLSRLRPATPKTP